MDEQAQPLPDRLCMGCASETCQVGRLWCPRCLRGDAKDLPPGYSTPQGKDNGPWYACYRGERLIWGNRVAAFPTQPEAVIFCRGDFGGRIRIQHFPVSEELAG